MLEQILEAWRINNRVNVRLLAAISDEGLRCTLSKRGGRTVARQFGHLHNVRIWHLQRRARAIAAGASLFATEDEPDRATLVAALADSSLRIEAFIRSAGEGASGVRTAKRGLVPNVAYFISHESHHRGSILLTLKMCGHPVARDVSMGIWDWDRL
ncbi:MAG: DinB family protein [Acidobacteriia bacterium]|nr:DinB family protein [Terriglobia bacterium]